MNYHAEKLISNFFSTLFHGFLAIIIWCSVQSFFFRQRHSRTIVPFLEYFPLSVCTLLSANFDNFFKGKSLNFLYASLEANLNPFISVTKTWECCFATDCRAKMKWKQCRVFWFYFRAPGNKVPPQINKRTIQVSNGWTSNTFMNAIYHDSTALWMYKLP